MSKKSLNKQSYYVVNAGDKIKHTITNIVDYSDDKIEAAVEAWNNGENYGIDHSIRMPEPGEHISLDCLCPFERMIDEAEKRIMAREIGRGIYEIDTKENRGGKDADCNRKECSQKSNFDIFDGPFAMAICGACFNEFLIRKSLTVDLMEFCSTPK
jgi:hypothetical protein